ncbi:uncharacterized protein LOC110232824 [Exaiptasia diaphana]|uniref:VWFA domain-containing protein n=1 Tax=Exaiptasia diaphana TaxID=2652724 RepID=A0A913WT34_EXADI|nr:uncharacterized protein LOC110232824 [Exaiptasia diaphana]
MPPKRSKASIDTEKVASSLFKTIHVPERTSIKAFVEKNKLEFAAGRGFYQLNKPETIQFHKEIVVRRKSDGAFVTGDELRPILGISKETTKFKMDKEKLEDFDVFIQSTSYNRILLPDTDFLYDTGKESDAASAKPKATPAAASTATKTRGKGKRKAKEPEEETAKEEIPKPSPSKKSKPEASSSAASSAEVSSDVKEIVFSFDTTGSMYPCLTQVRNKIEQTANRLLTEVKGMRIAIFAHGDYQDKRATYDTTWLDFTTDKKKIAKFVKNVSSTCGYDSDECYELVLRQVQTELSWTPGSQRALVMIGDCCPHPPNYPLNTLKINWKNEAKKLYEELGVRIYSIQCLGYSGANTFYKQLAELTCGWHLKLDQFSTIVDFLTAICYREQGIESLQTFEDEVRGRGSGMNRSLHKLFDTLSGRTTTYEAASEGHADFIPVDPSRFQILDVEERCDIKSFVQNHSLIFKTGKGFYEFTKPEKISHKKEVVIVLKSTGDMYTGQEVCDMIGVKGDGKIKVPSDFEKWRIFVQSTSYNRVLMPGTGFLYEVDTDH